MAEVPIGLPLPHEAFMAMTVLTVGALSSYAQCLFGLDGEGGHSRAGEEHDAH